MSAPEEGSKAPRRRRSAEEILRDRSDDALAVERHQLELGAASRKHADAVRTRTETAAAESEPFDAAATSIQHSSDTTPSESLADAAPATHIDAEHEADYLIGAAPTISDEDRRARLERMQPLGAPSDIAAVKPQVIDLIMRVDYKGWPTDRSLLTIGAPFAAWVRMHTPDAKFVPPRDLNELMIRDFLKHARPNASERSRQTYASQLRRLYRGGTRPRKYRHTRSNAQAPFSPAQRSAFWNAASALNDWQGIEARTVLALTFGAGCMPDEVNAMRVHQIEERSGRAIVQVARRHFVRDVPLYGAEGRWLLRRSAELDSDQYIFRPTYNTRHNAIADLVWRMKKHTRMFGDFDARRARHTWLVQALTVGVPMHALAPAAGVGASSNLLADMIPYLPNLTPTQIIRAFDQTYAHIKDVP